MKKVYELISSQFITTVFRGVVGSTNNIRAIPASPSSYCAINTNFRILSRSIKMVDSYLICKYSYKHDYHSSELQKNANGR